MKGKKRAGTSPAPTKIVGATLVVARVEREAMTLPNGWAWTTLGEIRFGERRSVAPAKTPDQMFELYSVPSFETGRPEIVSGKDVGSSKQVVNEFSVLVCKINPRINRVWVVGDYSQHPKIASTEWIAFEKLEGIDPHYLCYFMRTSTFHDFLAMNVSGVGGSLMRARASALEDYPFPLAPLSEQHRIVAEIEKQFTRLDAGVAALKRVQANLKRYKASVLKAACEGQLASQDPNDEPASKLLERILAERRKKWEEDLRTKGQDPSKAKYVEPPPPDTDGLPELPEGWCWAILAQLKSFSLYGPRFSSDDYSQEGRLVLRTSDISESGKVNLATAPRLSLDDQEFAKYRCEIGDLLITRTGSLGTLAVFNDQVDAIPGAYLIQYRLGTQLDTNWYVFYVLKSPRGQKYLVGKGAGVGRPNLNAPTIDVFPIPLPPLAEQRRIVAEVERQLSVVQEMEAVIAANLARAERLRQSILKQAFEGRLVPQDSNDEPASVLLQHIQNERAKRELEGQSKGRIARGKAESKQGVVEMKKAKERRALWDTLVEAKALLPPKELFDKAGFTAESVDEFYEELRDEVLKKQRIRQHRPNNTDVYLEAVKE